MGKIKKLLKKRRYLLVKIIVVIVIIIILFVSLVSYFKGNILPVVLTMSEATVKVCAVNAINNATHMVIDSTMTYEDFVSITKDENGKIQLIQANMVKINRLTRDLANLCQANIEKIGIDNVEIPLGAFTGAMSLSDIGPPVKIALLPIGSVQCDFTSLFEEVGINQTRHSIYINVKTTISLVLPVSSVPVNISTAILVCDNILVGEVPKVYFENNGSMGQLDLSPS